MPGACEGFKALAFQGFKGFRVLRFQGFRVCRFAGFRGIMVTRSTLAPDKLNRLLGGSRVFIIRVISMVIMLR